MQTIPCSPTIFAMAGQGGRHDAEYGRGLLQPASYPDPNRKGDVFRVPYSTSLLANDSGDKRNSFIEHHKYFVRVSWDTNNYYWDYQGCGAVNCCRARRAAGLPVRVSR